MGGARPTALVLGMPVLLKLCEMLGVAETIALWREAWPSLHGYLTLTVLSKQNQ